MLRVLRFTLGVPGLPGLKTRPPFVVALLALAVALPSAQTKALPRVYIHTDQSPTDGALKEREESVKDLKAVLASRKKVLTVIDNEDQADVTVEVLERTTTVPKVRIGISPPNSSVPGVGMPARTVRLRVRATRGDEKSEFTNKNTPFENDRGWESAADDVARQIEKWIFGKKIPSLVRP
jgi:hypothetical protein